MTTRQRMLGWTHIVFGVVGLGLAGLVLVSAGLANDAAYTDEYGFLLFWAGVLSVAYFVPSLIGGLGVLRGKVSGRLILWAEAALLLIFIPIGPLLAGYTIWALFTTRSAAWENVGMINIQREVRARIDALIMIVVGLAILGAIVGIGWLFRDMIDPPVAQELTPLPSGVPPQLPPDLVQPAPP